MLRSRVNGFTVCTPGVLHSWQVGRGGCLRRSDSVSACASICNTYWILQKCVSACATQPTPAHACDVHADLATSTALPKRHRPAIRQERALETFTHWKRLLFGHNGSSSTQASNSQHISKLLGSSTWAMSPLQTDRSLCSHFVQTHLNLLFATTEQPY